MTYDDCSTPSCGAAQLSTEEVSINHPLVWGIGLSDANHTVWANGKPTRVYNTWGHMLRRCYSARYQASHPTYIGCTVAVEWLRFSVFEEWMLTQDHEEKALDKDLLFPGNQVYSATNCVFVPQELNNLLNIRKAGRGDLPLGVSHPRDKSKFKARVKRYGYEVCLGTYDTPIEAHKQWQLAKADLLDYFPTDDLRVRVALDKRAAKLREDAANGRITTSL